MILSLLSFYRSYNDGYDILIIGYNVSFFSQKSNLHIVVFNRNNSKIFVFGLYPVSGNKIKVKKDTKYIFIFQLR